MAKAKGKGRLGAADGKMRELVMMMAELLEVANARVVKAVDDHGKLRETTKSLEAKVARIVSIAGKGGVGATGSAAAEHAGTLKELVDSRKELAAMAKDNAAGRLTRATAQELALQDDLKDLVSEKAEIQKRLTKAVAENRSDESTRLEAMVANTELNERTVLAELEKTVARNKKLSDAIESRKEVNLTPLPLFLLL